MPERAGHTKDRDADDYYATRPELAHLVCQTLKNDYIARPRTILEPNSILEPGCGSGTWLPGIRSVWPEATILGVERNPDLATFSRHRGFTVEQRDLLEGELGRYDLIVGNPPFKYADDLIPMLISCLNPGGILAFLLRLNFLEGQDRYERFWRIHKPAAIYPVVARPGFTPNGATDGTGYGVMCWQQGYEGEFTVLRHLDNRFVPFKWDGTPERTRKDGTIIPAVLDPNFPDPRKDGRMLADLPPAVLMPRQT
jgi:SAM-dependent methyltransferase